MINSTNIVDVITPDPWSDVNQEIVCMLNGMEISIYDVVGTTPAETPVLNHLGISGGKDSDALFLWALYESGYDRKSIVASFCDTMNEDRVTYEQIDLLRERHPVHRVVPFLGFFPLVRKKGFFPTRKKRYCTQFLKMVPCRYFVHALVSAGFKVVLHSGVRASESKDRAELPEEDFDTFFALPIKRPFLKQSIQDVVAIHRKYGLRMNPLYKLGARRVGCFPCINSIKQEVRIISNHRPEKIDQIEAEENDVSFLNGNPKTFFHRMTVPPRFRSLEFKIEDGSVIKVCGIRDVVRWSLTGHRAKEEHKDQVIMDFVEDSFNTCALTYGACE